VAYFPDAAGLQRLFAATLPQVSALVLVDNGAGDDTLRQAGVFTEEGKIVLLKQERNIGLAAGFNRGIAWARQSGHTHVLLLDQDSEPAPDMVALLGQALAAPLGGRRIAAAGPRFHDAREDCTAPFVRVGFPFNHKITDGGQDGLVACDFLISSGTLIPLEVLDALGAMDEGLFIDNVDMEWGFRALAKGYALAGVCRATMHHRLGHGRRPLPLGLGHIVVHDPVRLYYIMRNRLLLYGLPHTPALWIAQDLPRVGAKFLLFAILVPPRLRNIRSMLTGLRDGLRRRRGPLQRPDGSDT
jgi:rhamnosyltransferase